MENLLDLHIGILKTLKDFLTKNDLPDKIFLAMGEDEAPNLHHLSLTNITRAHAQVVRKGLLSSKDLSKYPWFSNYVHICTGRGQGTICLFSDKDTISLSLLNQLGHELKELIQNFVLQYT